MPSFSRTGIGALLLLLALSVAGLAEDSEDEGSFVDRDRSTLSKTEQLVRAIEILRKGGWTGDVGKASRMAEMDAHFKVLVQLRGRKVAWAAQVHEVLGAEVSMQDWQEEIEARMKARLVQGVRIVGYDADEDGTVYSYAKFRVVDVIKQTIKVKDWERLRLTFAEIEKRFPRDLEVVGMSALLRERDPEPGAGKREPKAPEDAEGPFVRDWVERWRKAKKRMGGKHDAHQKKLALEVAMLRARKNLILELKGMMDMEEHNYLSPFCGPEHLQKAFTIGQVSGVRFTNVYGVDGGYVFVEAKIKVSRLVMDVRTVNNFETLTRDQIAILEQRDRIVTTTGESNCNPEIREKTEPRWVPTGRVR